MCYICLLSYTLPVPDAIPTTSTGKYPSRAASSRRSNSNNNADIAEITIPKTKLVDNNGQNDCTEENIAVTFKNNGYRTGMIGEFFHFGIVIFIHTFRNSRKTQKSCFCSTGKWHLTRVNDNTYTYESAQETVKDCGFDFVGALFMENLASEGSFNNYSDGTFSHNMEWYVVLIQY